MHLTRPSVTWLNSRWWLDACDWVMLALSAVLLTGVGRRWKFGEVYSTECTGQRSDFELYITLFHRKKITRKELIPTVEMKTRNPIEGYFGSEFPAICNHCGVVAARCRKTLKIFRNFCVFWKNDPLRRNVQNSVPQVFIATPIDVLCSNFVKFGRRVIGEIVRCLPDKKLAWLCSCRFYADRAHNLPGQTVTTEL